MRRILPVILIPFACILVYGLGVAAGVEYNRMIGIVALVIFVVLAAVFQQAWKKLRSG